MRRNGRIVVSGRRVRAESERRAFGNRAKLRVKLLRHGAERISRRSVARKVLLVLLLVLLLGAEKCVGHIGLQRG